MAFVPQEVQLKMAEGGRQNINAGVGLVTCDQNMTAEIRNKLCQ